MQERLTHAAEYTYVRFWISNPNSAAISIMLQPVKDGTNCTLDAKSAVLVRCDGASVNTETSNASGAGEDTSVVVPAGFIGWVSYPLSVASVSLWNGKTCSLAEASQFKLDIRPSAPAVSEYYVLDDFVFSDSTSGKVRAYEYQDPKEEEYMKLREELDTKIKSYLNVVPEVQNYPKYDPIGKKNIKAITYEGATLNGKKTKVFAYLGYPEGAKAGDKLPAVVLVHGGGGHAFHDWVKAWTDRGYVAIAMDNTGFFPNSASAGMGGNDWTWGLPKGSDFAQEGYANVMQTDHFATSDKPIERQWMYHAVVQTILAHNLLKNDPAVDPQKVGITGISWGGKITALAMRYDQYAFAVPQYCSAYLNESLTHNGKYCKDYPAFNYLWVAEDGFDKIDYPVLWLQWTKDTSVTPNTNSLCYLHTKDQGGELSFIMNWFHGHDWSQQIVYYYADCAVNGKQALAKAVDEPVGRDFSFEITKPDDAQVTAKIWYMKHAFSEELEKNVWFSASASVNGNTVSGTVPADAAHYYVEFTNRIGGQSYFSATSIVYLNE